MKTNLVVLVLIAFSLQIAQGKTIDKKVEPLTVIPELLQTTLDQQHEFVVHGGTPPYIFKTSAGMIRYKDNAATYISPNQPGDAVVTVKDAKGLTKEILITVISETKESAESSDSSN